MSNKKIVLEALTGLFVRRDVSVLDTHFAPDYRQHNPTIGNGVAGLRAIAPKLSPSLKYEPGMIVEDGDIVMIHGRYFGWAEKPLVAVDISRARRKARRALGCDAGRSAGVGDGERQPDVHSALTASSSAYFAAFEETSRVALAATSWS